MTAPAWLVLFLEATLTRAAKGLLMPMCVYSSHGVKMNDEQFKECGERFRRKVPNVRKKRRKAQCSCSLIRIGPHDADYAPNICSRSAPALWVWLRSLRTCPARATKPRWPCAVL